MNQLNEALVEINELAPTRKEIVEYAKQVNYYGVVTNSKSYDYFPPIIHNTWLTKEGGRVHIDIGSDGYHLMLDKIVVWDFIDFIKKQRLLHTK